MAPPSTAAATPGSIAAAAASASPAARERSARRIGCGHRHFSLSSDSRARRRHATMRSPDAVRARRYQRRVVAAPPHHHHPPLPLWHGRGDLTIHRRLHLSSSLHRTSIASAYLQERHCRRRQMVHRRIVGDAAEMEEAGRRLRDAARRQQAALDRESQSSPHAQQPPPPPDTDDADITNTMAARAHASWYYVDSSGGTVGPLSNRRMLDLTQSGLIQPETRVWAEHLPGWATLDAVNESLRREKEAKAAAAPPPLSTRSRQQSQPMRAGSALSPALTPSPPPRLSSSSNAGSMPALHLPIAVRERASSAAEKRRAQSSSGRAEQVEWWYVDDKGKQLAQRQRTRCASLPMRARSGQKTQIWAAHLPGWTTIAKLSTVEQSKPASEPADNFSGLAARRRRKSVELSGGARRGSLPPPLTSTASTVTAAGAGTADAEARALAAEQLATDWAAAMQRETERAEAAEAEAAEAQARAGAAGGGRTHRGREADECGSSGEGGGGGIEGGEGSHGGAASARGRSFSVCAAGRWRYLASCSTAHDNKRIRHRRPFTIARCQPTA